MRENCLSGSEGGGPDRPVRPPYPYQFNGKFWVPAFAGTTSGFRLSLRRSGY